MRKRGKYEASAPVRRSGKKVSIHLQMLVTSAVSFVLCCSMLLGTTMAWFSDTITSSPNQIIVGTLKVDALCDNLSLRDSAVPVFSSENGTKVWQPEDVQTREFTIKNEGNLELDYTLTFLSETISEDTKAAFEHFLVYVKKGAHTTAGLNAANLADNENEWTPAGNLYDIITNSRSVFSGNLKPKGDDLSSEVYTVALVLDPNAPSKIQGANLTVNIQLKATQTVQETTPTTPVATEDSVTPSEGEQSE